MRAAKGQGHDLHPLDVFDQGNEAEVFAAVSGQAFDQFVQGGEAGGRLAFLFLALTEEFANFLFQRGEHAGCVGKLFELQGRFLRCTGVFEGDLNFDVHEGLILSVDSYVRKAAQHFPCVQNSGRPGSSDGCATRE